MGGKAGKFSAVGVGPPGHMPGIFNDGDLHAQADAEIRHVVLPGVLCCQDHALDTTVAEAAGHQNAGAISQHPANVFRRQALGVHPFDIHPGVAGRPRMEQGLDHAEIGVVEAGIFAHQGDLHGLVYAVDAADQRCPFRQIRLPLGQAQLPAGHPAQALLLQQQRHLIQSGGRQVLDNAVLLHVAEQGNLPPQVLRQGTVGAAHQNIRLNAHGQQLLHGVLGGLAFQLTGAGDGHHQGHMDIQHVFPALFCRHLADGLQIGLALNIAHGAAYLSNDDVGLTVVHGIDAALDLVGNMGDDLDGAAQIAALAFPVQHIPEHLARGHRRVSRQGFVHEALIVAQVQVRLRAVIGDEHLAVLEGAHGAGIHIKIGIKLLIFHPEAPLLQQPPQGCRADALSQPGHHAAGNKDMLHRDHSLPAEYHVKILSNSTAAVFPRQDGIFIKIKNHSAAIPAQTAKIAKYAELFLAFYPPAWYGRFGPALSGGIFCACFQFI